MYSRILVPLDGSSESEQVLPYARQIGRALGARLDVIRVMEPLRFDSGRTRGAEVPRRSDGGATRAGIRIPGADGGGAA